MCAPAFPHWFEGLLKTLASVSVKNLAVPCSSSMSMTCTAVDFERVFRPSQANLKGSSESARHVHEPQCVHEAYVHSPAPHA